jgi:hypothetical protein
MSYDVAISAELEMGAKARARWRVQTVDSKKWKSFARSFPASPDLPACTVQALLDELERAAATFAVDESGGALRLRAVVDAELFREKGRQLAALFAVAARVGARGEATFVGVGATLGYRVVIEDERARVTELSSREASALERSAFAEATGGGEAAEALAPLADAAHVAVVASADDEALHPLVATIEARANDRLADALAHDTDIEPLQAAIRALLEASSARAFDALARFFDSDAAAGKLIAQETFSVLGICANALPLAREAASRARAWVEADARWGDLAVRVLAERDDGTLYNAIDLLRVLRPPAAAAAIAGVIPHDLVDIDTALAALAELGDASVAPALRAEAARRKKQKQVAAKIEATAARLEAGSHGER